MTDWDRAQKWHDTDHGTDRGKPLRTTKFIQAAPDPEPEWVSSCFCCCERCDPDYGGNRPNPYFDQALGE